jgi:hypothetical protein
MAETFAVGMAADMLAADDPDRFNLRKNTLFRDKKKKVESCFWITYNDQSFMKL